MNFLGSVGAGVQEWPVLLEVAFLLYAVIAFIRVMTYIRRKAQAGQLMPEEKAPPRFRISPVLGALFVVGVMALLFLQSPFYMVLVVMGVTAFLAQSGRTGWEQFGLGRLSAGRLVQWSLLLCGALIFVELPLGQIIARGMSWIHLPHPEQESVEIFRQIRKPAEIFAFLVQAVFLSPMIEEIFFRGFLLTFLKDLTSTRLALLLSAGIFAFAHVNLGSVLQLWVLGLVLGVAYEHTGSLLLPMGVHACWNFLTAMSLLLEKGSS